MKNNMLLTSLVITTLGACTLDGPVTSDNSMSAVPKDFVVFNGSHETLTLDIRYHTSNNFVGSPIEGYQAPFCILQQQAAKGLKRAADAAAKDGYRIKVFDCYRPQRAVDHFVRWSEDLSDIKTKADYYPSLDKSEILGPYVASKSGHSRGSTLDVTLQAKNESGQWQDLDMGTRFDFFDSRSNTAHPGLSQKVAENRARLIGYMRQGDFNNYPMEWWHFSYQNEAYPNTYFDFPVQQ